MFTRTSCGCSLRLEIADWSVSAILVAPHAVWMGLAAHPEGPDWSGGLLRFDRVSERVRRFDFPDVVHAMARLKGEILMAGSFGIGIVRDGRVTRYFVDRSSDGRYRMAEAIGKPVGN